MADITQVQLTDTFSTLVDRLNEAIARANALGTQAAVVITGGAISGVTLTSSAINSTPIGATTPSTGRFSSLSLENPLAVTQGGTGAITAEGARTSLGFANASNLTEGVLSDERIPNLSANKIVDGIFTVGNFSVDMSLTKSGAAKIAAKGTGSSEAYSYLSLESDESEDKGWQIFHRKDAANRLAFYYNLTQMAAYFDPTTRGFVVGSTTSGGSPAVGSINAKSYYVDGVKISDAATSDLAGIIELATNAEAIAGADTSRAVTPAGLTAVIADRIATSGEAIALTSTTELITPALLAAVFGNTTARTTLDVASKTSVMDIETISSNDTLVSSDSGSTKKITADITIAFDAAATLGNGWWVELVIDGDYNDFRVVTLDPNGTEKIDEQNSIKVYGGERLKIVCDGTKFRTFGRDARVFFGEQSLGTGSTYSFFTDGAFVDDPEIDELEIIVDDASHDGGATARQLYLRLSSGAGVVDSGDNYSSSYISTTQSDGTYFTASADDEVRITESIDGTVKANAKINIVKVTDCALIEWQGMQASSTPRFGVTNYFAQSIGGFQLRWSGSNFSSGKVKIWGRRGKKA